MQKRAGRLITFEGGDGSGKTTQLKLLEKRLIQNHIEVLTTREPGGTEMLILFAARAHHLSTIIIPDLNRGCWVLCDRFTDATFAYQGGGGGLDQKRISQLEKFVQKGIQPDLTLLLDIPVEEGLSRVKKRGGSLDRFEKLDRMFKERVRQAYLTRQTEEPLRICLIDASDTIEAMHEIIWSNVSKLL